MCKNVYCENMCTMQKYVLCKNVYYTKMFTVQKCKLCKNVYCANMCPVQKFVQCKNIPQNLGQGLGPPPLNMPQYKGTH